MVVYQERWWQRWWKYYPLSYSSLVVDNRWIQVVAVQWDMEQYVHGVLVDLVEAVLCKDLASLLQPEQQRHRHC
jgi:hypothetical protein